MLLQKNVVGAGICGFASTDEEGRLGAGRTKVNRGTGL